MCVVGTHCAYATHKHLKVKAWLPGICASSSTTRRPRLLAQRRRGLCRQFTRRRLKRSRAGKPIFGSQQLESGMHLPPKRFARVSTFELGTARLAHPPT
jgi:hypothetical protein